MATLEDGDRLYGAAHGRPVDALLANAGHGLGRSFLEQDSADVKRVIDTNITGTIYLVQKFLREMAQRNQGCVLITGSLAGHMPAPSLPRWAPRLRCSASTTNPGLPTNSELRCFTRPSL